MAQTFSDVPTDYWAFSFIESLAARQITAGCGNGNYCPESPVTRAQMAVFLERGMHGSSFNPPAATGNVFLDIGAGDFAASFIEQLSQDGITAGCGNGNYCPDVVVSRDQMAVFLLRAKYGAGHSPPAASGVFGDVDLGHWAVHWIEQLAAEGITAGCGGGNYCPEGQVTRDQMAVFLVRTFSPPKLSAMMTPQGGAISIYNSVGDLITLELPAGALQEDTLITVTALDSPPAAPFVMGLFPGVVLEPHGLILEQPATLTVAFHDVQSNPEQSLLFWALSPENAIPLANQVSTPTQLSADIHHFSEMAGGQPSAAEADEQADRLAALPQLVTIPIDDPLNWIITQDVVFGLMSLRYRASELGDAEAASDYHSQALGALAFGSLTFLNFTPPAMPCEDYTPILHRFLDLATSMLGDTDTITQLLQARLFEIDSVWCCFSLDGVWLAVETADETACEEGVNTYYEFVSIGDVDGVLVVEWGGGHAGATKTQCAIGGWGGESEDRGVSYGGGGGTVSADGGTINISVGWTWDGIDPDTGEPDSCSGSSNITLTR